MTLELKKIQLSKGEYHESYSMGSAYFEVVEEVNRQLSVRDVGAIDLLKMVNAYAPTWTTDEIDVLAENALFIGRVKTGSGKNWDNKNYEDIILNRTKDKCLLSVVSSEFYKQAKEMDVRKHVTISFLDTRKMPEPRILELLS